MKAAIDAYVARYRHALLAYGELLTQVQSAPIGDAEKTVAALGVALSDLARAEAALSAAVSNGWGSP